MTEVTMATIIESVTSVFTASIGWMGEIVGEIATQPILLLMVVSLPVVGFAVGITRRILSL